MRKISAERSDVSQYWSYKIAKIYKNIKFVKKNINFLNVQKYKFFPKNIYVTNIVYICGTYEIRRNRTENSWKQNNLFIKERGK